MRLAILSLLCVPSLVLRRSRVIHSIDSSFGFSNKQCFQRAHFSSQLKLLLYIKDRNLPVHSGQSTGLLSNSPKCKLVLVNFCDCQWKMVRNRSYHFCLWIRSMFVYEIRSGNNRLSLPPKGVL